MHDSDTPTPQMKPETGPPECYVTLEELSRITKTPVSWFYERSRRNALPGQRRMGRHIRVDLEEFRAGLKHAGVA